MTTKSEHDLLLEMQNACARVQEAQDRYYYDVFGMKVVVDDLLPKGTTMIVVSADVYEGIKRHAAKLEKPNS